MAQGRDASDNRHARPVIFRETGMRLDGPIASGCKRNCVAYGSSTVHQLPKNASGRLGVKPQQNRIGFTLSGQRYTVQRQVSQRLTLELPIKQRLPKSPLIVVVAARVPSEGAIIKLTFTIMRRRNSVTGAGTYLWMRKKGDLHESS
jgi:hypothetical protein